MLYVIEGSVAVAYHTHRWKCWRPGEEAPQLASPVVTFEASGEELALILDALRKREVPHGS